MSEAFPYGIDSFICASAYFLICSIWMELMMTEKTEKIVIFRRIWKEGKAKYVISIPKEIVEHYKLEGKFIKAILEVIEDGDTSSKDAETV